jgi:acyl carrier protein
LRTIRDPSATVIANTAADEYLAHLRTLNRSDMENEVQRHLLARLARTLDTAPAKIDPRQSLISMGIDSLMAAQFRNTVRDELGIELPFGRLLEGATLLDVAQVLVAKLLAASSAPFASNENEPLSAPELTGTVVTKVKRLDAVSAEATFDVELESGEV